MNLDDFEGIMIEVEDPFIGKYRVPGWECKVCGWKIGSIGEPPHHNCPDEGIQQQCQHRWGDDMFYESPANVVYRECSKCGKREHRFASGRWLD